MFLGLSAGGVLKGEMVSKMAERPLILALANPVPEILPDEVHAVRDDAVIATGRSDYPNQVNNVLCFPFLFRGALDAGATAINEEMMLACVKAIADLARAEASDIVAKAYSDQELRFGAEYLIPKPFDPRLLVKLAPAVAKAAMDSGVATRPIEDLDANEDQLSHTVYRTGLVMKPVLDRARSDPKHVAFAEGEDDRVLQAAQIALDEGLARPVLIGRRYVLERRLERLGLRMRLDQEVDVVDPEGDSRFRDYWSHYHDLMGRRGVSPDEARTIVRTRTTVIGALMLVRGDADALLCGTQGRFARHLRDVEDVVGLAPGVRAAAALQLLLTARGGVFLADTSVTAEPSAEDFAEIAVRAAAAVRRFGLEPNVALISNSDFGSADSPSAQRMRAALALLRERAPSLDVDGELSVSAALDPGLRARNLPATTLSGPANLLILPGVESASASFQLARTLADGTSVGPVLLGLALPAHVVVPAVTVRGLVNLTALAVVDAQDRAGVPA